ncbi:MAG: T9SS type A sorting domain-containing protein [Bacteroidetes bacterium]|nr:T9SS type A sorting domain-containing protein [Bacteroidota bacterium]
MKHVFFYIFIILWSHSFSQSVITSKRDYQWIMGCGNNPAYGWSGWMLDFFNTPPDTSTYLLPQNYYLANTDAVICDTSGHFLYSSNGSQVLGRDHQILPNGDSLGYGFIYHLYEGKANRIPHGTMILSFYDTCPLYNVIHEMQDSINMVYHMFNPNKLLYTVIDKRLNQGIGAVTTKNNRIFNDTLSFGFGVTRHANGRDWWIVEGKVGGRVFHAALMTPQGIYSSFLQEFDTLFFCYSSYLLQEDQVFSPDGCKFAMSSFLYDSLSLTEGTYCLKIFGFDRCTGHLSFIDQSVEHMDYAPFGGLCFSGNSRYLYNTRTWSNNVTDSAKCYQYDLEAPDIFTSRKLVGDWDGFYDINTCYDYIPGFLFMQLGPDNKIYIEGNATRYWHVIENPDNPGPACNLVQRKIRIPYWNACSIPYLPNFRLGPITGSVCDSLSTAAMQEIPSQSISLKLFPNPAGEALYVNTGISHPVSQITITLTDLAGRIIIQRLEHSAAFTMDVSGLAEGYYLLQVRIPGMIPAVVRLAVQR